MSTTALAERPTTALAPPVVTTEQRELLRRTYAPTATDDEFELWLYDNARQGVHPLDRLIHFTKRKGKYVPITSIDFMRMRAAETGDCAGIEDATFVEQHNQSYPLSATVTVWRFVQGQRCAFTATARWSEYKPDDDWMWRRMPYTMLGKCAEALALRKGFPKQLSGLYVAEEMEQADNRSSPPRATTPPAVPDLTATARSAAAGTPASPSVPAASPAEPDGGNPSPPTGDDSAVVIDQETGEELIAPPPGFHFVRHYRLTPNGWHEASLLNFDGQGGAMRVSTTGAVGARLKEAQEQNIPVKVQTSAKKSGAKGEAYLVDKFGVRFYDPSLEDIPF